MTTITMQRPPAYARFLAGLLSLLLGLGPIATPAFADLTPLADQPLGAQVSAKPNVVLTIDDSTSMLYDFLPDATIGTNCRGATGSRSVACGFGGAPLDLSLPPPGYGSYKSVMYIYEQYGSPFPAYTSVFPASGPGAGCNTSIGPPTCAAGVSPGALPGLSKYPTTQGLATAGQPYEYWLFWPAPAHNNAVNALYYNPMLTYQPAVASDGTPYPSMNSANTTGWTRVPANPFLHLDNPWGYPADTTAPLVDLTATVTVGKWCNSDWTQGNDDSGSPFSSNQTYCRSNGNISAAGTDSTPANDGDYSYPWAPASITPNDFTTKVDMTAINITSTPPVNATVKPAWSTAQNGKYFYENENVLWCDITSAAWPKTGDNPLGQTCTNQTTPQACNPNAVQPTCAGSVAGACAGASGVGTCNGLATSGTCSNGTATGVCTGYSTGTCQNYSAGVCNGGVAAKCNNIPTCTGSAAAACAGQTNQACNGYVAPVCGGLSGQTCSGGTPVPCNPVAQTCNGYGGAQTCNLVLIPQDPSTCPSAWVPAGCNINPDPENPAPCVYQPVCTPKYKGTCNISGATCTTTADCPTILGKCSVQTSKTCTSNADCTGLSYCQGTSNTCTSSATCGFTASSGRCTRTNAVCTSDSDCPPAGTCNNPSTTVCTTNGQCTAIGGKCAISNGACVTSANCPITPNSGTCNYKNTGGVTNGACSANTDCQAKPSTCSAPSGTVCTAITQCTPGTCAIGGAACTTNATCPATGNTCANNGPTKGLPCTVASGCTTLGTCSNASTTTCTTNANCTINGKCSLYPAIACTGTSSTACKTNGSCTTGNVGASCNTNGPGDTACAKAGICSNNATLACTSSTGCPAIQGHCTAGNTGAVCTTGADCNVANTCGSSQNNGTVCTTVAQCTPLKGSCAVQGNTCTTSADCTKSGVCSLSGATCYANADCGNLPGPLNPVIARCDSTGVSGSATATLLADANGAGLTCRRNNHAYASDGTLAARFNYPSGKFTTPVSGENTAGLGCHASDHYANVPRHYWNTSVEYCTSAISTAADKWNGYGDNTTGNCQSFSDSTHVYPRFYQYGSGTDTVSNYTTPAFSRTDLTSATTTFTHTTTDASGAVTTVSRTYAQEMENYANWFAYYHDRIQAVKTATSLAFLGTNTDGTYNLDETKFRVGLHTLSNAVATSFVNVNDFSLSQKQTWATALFAIDIQLGQETPSLNAMARIGDYFQNGTSSSLPGSVDPIILSCQKNFHMLFTDGITNQPVPTTLAGDVDDLVPANLVGAQAVPGLTAGYPWPAPFREDAATALTANSLSDYATLYWSTDLRTTGALATNNVPTNSADPAYWQHINFAALSLGTQGKLSGNQAQVQTQLNAGTIQWPVPYPSVNKPDASGVDDLWHAAVNGRGKFVNAKSVAELQVGMGQILADALNSQGARSGVAFTNSNLTTTGNNYIYRSTFQPSWGGTLEKIQLDPTTGAEMSPSIWQAQVQLAAQLTPTAAIPDPWRDNRKVVTLTTTGSPVAFLWANISASQQDALAPGNPSRGQEVLAWLRGDQSNEGTTLGQFRQRDYSVAGALGDIVDSSAQYVGPPNFPFQELNDPGYTTFLSTWSSRPGRVYVGANDGMLHAFDDSTGNETFGYVPLALYRAPSDAGLGSLTYQFGGLPPFIHHFFVDSTPKLTDVAFGVPSAKNWHSILVGGLGKGGTSYYALDVTNPGAITSEATAASNILWEFTDPDMGYTYGPPLVTKTRGFGGKWVVIVPSGYNNASGIGKIWILDPQTGSILKTMSTGSGTATDPAGLAQIAGYTQNFQNYLTDQIYAGDLHGNLWRFDMLDPNPSNWVVNKMAVFTDPSGVPQPVTVPPQIEVDINNATDRWVFVGTGKLLDDSDLSNTQVQTMYALRDGTTKLPNTIVSGAPIQRSDLNVVTDATGLPSAPAKGWLQDLTDKPGQRVVTPVQAALSIVVYAATSPNTDPCVTGQPAEVFARNYSQGNSVITDSSGVVQPFYESDSGAVGISIVTTGNNGTGENPDGSLYVPTVKAVITLGSTGQTVAINLKTPTFLYASRMSWRTLNE